MVANAIDVRIENQLVRFVPPQPVDQDSVVAQLGGQKTGGVVIKVLDRPRATIVIDQQGRIVVHGTHRVEAARAAAKEMMLRLGLNDSGLETELGPVVASFEFGQSLLVESVVGDFGAGTAHYDERLGCATVEDTRHNLTLHMWPNGRCIATDARHRNMVAMAAVFWKGRFSDKKLLVDRI
ncbi:MAG: hypothetical protein HN444_01455 [Euryarchaeota archaeon]|jgi:TATA-box binding protein (TBP) (component of TFIID and TFIIIB)|nr:hypothetical protein [Euryarchaeota archaeon]MDA8557744.1 hypothetical protein [Candidatus Poseidoniales archaeon]MDA8790240.1 hypothetical protein [bacterium]MDC0528302.1 hypothetical protein [Candidatus Poseidoniaceae archaeon]MBT5121738.1 hypothetical protein [Euryarchaeota archaeon]